MAIDPQAAVGAMLPPTEMTVDPGRLRFFAKAIGETEPVYYDTQAAQAAGHPDLPVPPTFLFGLELEQSDPFAWLDGLGVDLRRVLHGEQSFSYRALAHAGDTLRAQPRITDVYAKKGGALEFIVKETQITRLDGNPVADLTSVIVVRNPEVRP